MPKIAQRHIRSWTVLAPPLEEQRSIVQAVVEDTAVIDRTSLGAQTEISLLREYRTRLIADVVTGKLDVRKAATRLPDEVEEPEPLNEADAEVEEDAVDDLDAAAEQVEA